MPSIAATLSDLFQQHRHVFWYTEPGEEESRAEFEQLELEGVDKRELDHNSFQLKRELLLVEPTRRFLVFSDQVRPPLEHNWLRDLELAGHLFTADPAAMYVQDLGLSPVLVPVAKEHIGFFKAQARRQALESLLADQRAPDDATFRLALVGATVGSETDWPHRRA